jgi:acyl carrier protein
VFFRILSAKRTRGSKRGEVATGSTIPDEARLTREIIEIVATIAEREASEMDLSSRLEDLGIDSLDGLRIVAEVEQRYGVTIDEREMSRIRSIPDILEAMRRYASEGS